MDNFVAIYLGIGMVYALIEVILNELSVFLATNSQTKELFTNDMELIFKHEDGAKLLVELTAADKFTKPWGIIHRIGIDIFAWPFEMVDDMLIYTRIIIRLAKKDS